MRRFLHPREALRMAAVGIMIRIARGRKELSDHEADFADGPDVKEYLASVLSEDFDTAPRRRRFDRDGGRRKLGGGGFLVWLMANLPEIIALIREIIDLFSEGTPMPAFVMGRDDASSKRNPDPNWENESLNGLASRIERLEKVVHSVPSPA